MRTRPPMHRPSGSAPRHDAIAMREKNDPARARLKKFRGSGRSKRFMYWHAARWPMCCDPFGHHERGGVSVLRADGHHVIHARERETRLVERNVAPVCRACHNKITDMESNGTPTLHLFKPFQTRVDERNAQKAGT